jgi:transposase
MRGMDVRSGSLSSYVDLEQRVPVQHSPRVIKAIVDDVFVSLNAEFAPIHGGTGHSSIAPERLLRASLMQATYDDRHG